jgi:pSer/pThr/pTyr-binding forkhead associated (FHA) protein
MSTHAAGSPQSRADQTTPQSAARTTARLILPTNEDWPLTIDVVSIGRRIGNHILIDDPLVSADHAEIVRVGERHVLLDLRSSNGTLVNGQRIEDLHILRDGDQIQIADQQFLFTAPASAGDSPAPASPDHPDGTSGGSAALGVLLFKELPLADRELTIGRTPENQLVLNDPRVSSEHAKIVRTGNDYWLLDLRSSNGTFVNEQRVRDVHLLRDGDLIALGATTVTFARRTIRFEDESAEPEVAAAMIFQDATGKRWVRVRISAIVVAAILVAFLVLFFRFILQ